MNRAGIDMAKFSPTRIRNFSIVAHIDHGKTTLSDRLLQLTGTVTKDKTSDGASVTLDALSVERDRGITVKAHTASLFVKYKGEVYLLNLIDTPGHVDFNYEVSRSLRACQGALLVVDASQGVQAQTVANFFLAFEAELNTIPVINKIDLPVADVKRCMEELHKSFGFRPDEVLQISAKTGIGMDQILPAIIERIPAPAGDPSAPFKALLFDSWYETHQGVVCLVRVIDGRIRKGETLVAASTKQSYGVMDTGILYPSRLTTGALYTGQVGYLILGMRSTKEARVGDTLMAENSTAEPLPGFKPARPMVYAGLYPVDGDTFDQLEDAIGKLTLNDASVSPQKETSAALGLGFRCGFLGLLHMSVFLQRLEEEYGVAVIPTAPTVPYRLHLTDGSTIQVDNPADFPETSKIRRAEEIWVEATIVLPSQYLSAISQLCLDHRGEQVDLLYLDPTRVTMKWKLPLAEVISDFFDSLKAISSGYASLDYEEKGFQLTDLVKLSILLNGEPVDPLSMIVHKSKALQYGRQLVDRLKAEIPRHMFVIAVQVCTLLVESLAEEACGRLRLAIRSSLEKRKPIRFKRYSVAHSIAICSISALRKDVTAKCYGGDITRKKKLLDKQKEGKKKMKRIGRVEVSQEAFMSVLKKSPTS
jgi:elongation factor 4